MELLIQVCLGGSCSIVLRDETGISPSGYLPLHEQLDALGRFKFGDTCTIIALTHNKSTGSELLKPLFVNHQDPNHPITVPVDFDGWFTVNYIVIPTVDWFVRERAKGINSAIHMYEAVYFTNGQLIYKCVDDEVTEVDVEELIERNALGTNLSRATKNHVSICHLKQCYLRLCQLLFNKGFSACFGKNDALDDIIFRRDVALMVINAVTYLTLFNQLAEALRLIEKIGGCNGICPSDGKVSISGCGCGCGCHKS